MGVLVLCLIPATVAAPAATSLCVYKALGRAGGVIMILLWFVAMFFGTGPLYRAYISSACAANDDCLEILLAPMFVMIMLLLMSGLLVATLVYILIEKPRSPNCESQV